MREDEFLNIPDKSLISSNKASLHTARTFTIRAGWHTRIETPEYAKTSPVPTRGAHIHHGHAELDTHINRKTMAQNIPIRILAELNIGLDVWEGDRLR